MDRIDLLEAKVKEMITLVQTLRNENRALSGQLAEAREKLAGLGEERELLDQERDVVKDRIEQLLDDLESARNDATPAPADAADLPDIDPGRELAADRDTSADDGPTQISLDTEGDQETSGNPVLPGMS